MLGAFDVLANGAAVHIGLGLGYLFQVVLILQIYA